MRAALDCFLLAASALLVAAALWTAGAPAWAQLAGGVAAGVGALALSWTRGPGA